MPVFSRSGVTAPAVRRFLVAVLAAGLLAALIPALLLGLREPGLVLPLVRVLMHLASLTAIAFLTAGVLLPRSSEESEQLPPLAVRLGRHGSFAALAAVVVCGVLLLATYFDVLGAGLSQGAVLADFGTFLNELASGRALLAQIGFLLVSAVLARIARTSTTLRMALFLAVAGTTTLALGGHAATEAGHSVAMFSMTGHIAAASLWVGGLAGMAWLAVTGAAGVHAAVTRFSRLALVCAAVVALSGVVSALVRVPDPSVLPASLYGGVLLVKVAVLVVLIGFGVVHRRRLLSGGSFTRLRFVQLAAGELVVMGVAYGLAVALVGLDPPLV